MHEYTHVVVIADASGSMREAGKHVVLRTLVAYIQYTIRTGINGGFLTGLILLSLGGETKVMEFEENSDIPELPIGGKTSISKLLPVLSSTIEPLGRVRVLLLSDGRIPHNEFGHFSSWQHSNPKVSLRAIAIGPDANWAALKKHIGKDNVFSAEDISQALHPWPLAHGFPPRLTDEIKLKKIWDL
jgi:hypothetical protein